MRAPGAFDLQAVDLLSARSSPSGCAARSSASAGRCREAARCAPRRWIARISSSTVSSVAAISWCIGGRIVALDEIRLVAVAREAAVAARHRGIRREHRRIGDLVAVEVQDRQHRAVARRIEKLVGMPGGGERAGFGLAVADRRRRRSDRDCRTPRHRRAPARSRVRRPRGSSPAFPARHGSECRRETRTAGTASACPSSSARRSG